MKRARSKLGLLLVLGMLTAILPVGAITAASAGPQDLVISGVVDATLTGGIPKAVEFYVVNDIADLSAYGMGSANNGGGSDGEEFTFPAVSATAGDYIYVASETTGFTSFFGFAPDYTSSAASINGDDAIELFNNGTVIDVFGDINADGNGTPWEYLDGWAYRVDATGPDGSTFVLSNWTFSGPDALDGETSNATATTPFPIGTYTDVTGPTPLSGTGEATPSAVAAGDNILLTVTVTPADTPPSTGITVEADLSAIGGSATQTLFDDGTAGDVTAGDSVFSYDATVSGSTLGGAYALPVAIADAEGRSASAAINLSVTALVPIYDVQGSGLASPFDGLVVIIEGVVTADYQDGELNGFAVQEVVGDGVADTSDGIFVFEGGNLVDVAVGDVVRVTGEVDEFHDLTEITNVSTVELTGGTELVTATEVALPWASLVEAENYEGMLVNISQPLVISEYFNYDQFGEIVLTTDRAAQPTARFNPGSPEAAQLAIDNQLGRITLDDARTSSNPDPARHPNGIDFDLTNLFRGGDTVENVIGMMSYSFGSYRIQPTAGADYTAANPRQAAPDDVGGNLTVASFNVLNYFSTIDIGAEICGPGSNLGCRGANNAEEFTRQRDKVFAALADIDADIVGLIEIENHVTDAALIDLVDGLNAHIGMSTYNYVATGPVGGDAIKVAFIYKPATVSLDGAFSVLAGDFLDPNNTGRPKNRAALAQTFTENATGEAVTVAVNHLKSKGSGCGAGDDDPEAGSCNLTRTLAAQMLVDWLGDSTNGFDEDILVIGDLNSYDKEDPIDALVAGGYTDLVFDFLGEEAYSFVFSGQWGYLDYAMANSSLQSAVTGTTVWHISADEPDILDYNTDFAQPAQQALYEPNAFRASDHDPVIVGLQLDRTAPVVTAEFDKIYAGYITGLFTIEYSCVDEVDPDPTCVGDINGISVDDGQRVFLIKSKWGRSWHRQIGSTLFIKDSSFTLTVIGTDDAGNTATATAEPEFRTWSRHRNVR